MLQKFTLYFSASCIYFDKLYNVADHTISLLGSNSQEGEILLDKFYNVLLKLFLLKLSGVIQRCALLQQKSENEKC